MGACVYSQVFRDIPLVGPNAISKNANNVVISVARVIIFSQNTELFHSFPHMWSPDHNHSRFGRQGAPIFFRIRFSRQPLELYPKFFQGRVPPDGPYWSSRCHGVRGSSNFFCFLYSNRHRLGARNMTRGNYRDIGPLSSLKFKKNRIARFRENGV